MSYSNMHRRGLAEGRRADGNAVYVPTLAEAERDERECGQPAVTRQAPVTREDFEQPDSTEGAPF